MTSTDPTAPPDVPPVEQGPEPDFAEVVQAFGLQAMMACGKIMSPITNRFETNLDLARYHIGVLGVLSEKTQGNLSPEEKEMLDGLLHQARMAYVDAKRDGPIESAEPAPDPASSEETAASEADSSRPDS